MKNEKLKNALWIAFAIVITPIGMFVAGFCIAAPVWALGQAVHLVARL